MNLLKSLPVVALVLLSSCALRKAATADSYLPQQQEALAGLPRQTASQPADAGKVPDIITNYEAGINQALVAETNAPAFDNQVQNKATDNATKKKVQSFAEMKAMVKNGSITMSKADQKVLNKLEKLTQTKKAPLREDPFELTTLAKIIFGIGAAGLLIYLFGGGLFFLFLFMVGLGAFFCRWIQIIDF